MTALAAINTSAVFWTTSAISARCFILSPPQCTCPPPPPADAVIAIPGSFVGSSSSDICRVIWPADVGHRVGHIQGQGADLIVHDVRRPRGLLFAEAARRVGVRCHSRGGGGAGAARHVKMSLMELNRAGSHRDGRGASERQSACCSCAGATGRSSAAYAVAERCGVRCGMGETGTGPHRRAARAVPWMGPASAA